MRLPHKPAAVVFDMDGLIFDTEALYQEAMLAVGAESGVTVTTELFLNMVGRPWTVNRQFLLDHFGAGFAVDAFGTAWWEQFARMAPTRLALKAGVLELLDTLDAMRLPRAIATSSQPHSVQHHLTRFDLGRRFDTIVAQGDTVRGKPAPDPYLLAAERLGVEPRLCLALEDSHNGVRSASAAGMMTIMVPDLLPPTDEIRALCVGVARDLTVVGRLLTGLRQRDTHSSPATT
jgi:HAD superfamily hydrolase (TIGR01509 family)